MKTGNLNGVDLKSNGGGTNFLADDGAYKSVGGGSQDLQSVLDEGNTADKGASFGDTTEVNAGVGTSSIFRVGQNTSSTNTGENGVRINANSNGNNFLDFKNILNGRTYFRCGQYDEYGYDKTWMELIPSTGDVIFKNSLKVGDDTEIDGDLIVNQTDGTSSKFYVGDDTKGTASNEVGYRVNASTNGNIYIDHKTFAAKKIFHGCGAGAEIGDTHTYQEVDAETGDLLFNNNIEVNGETQLNDRLRIDEGADTRVAFYNSTVFAGQIQATSDEIRLLAPAGKTSSMWAESVKVIQAEEGIGRIYGILALESTTNSSPSDGDVWRDSSDGKLKFRENGVTYNFN